MITLSSPVSALYGVGPEAEKKLAKLEITTVYDLISYLPRRYNDWTNVSSILGYEEGKEISFLAQVATTPLKKGFKKMSPVAFYVSDGQGRIELSFFNSPYIINKFSKDDKVFVHGMVTVFNGRPQIVNPYVEKIGAGDIQLVRPVYHLTAGVTSAMLSKWIKTALKLVVDQIPNVIPQSIIDAEGLCSVADAYHNVHFPQTVEEASQARRRIAYEELILLGIGMKYFMHKDSGEELAPKVIPDKLPESVAQRWKTVINNLGFELTDDQKKALRDIQADLMTSKPMNRLVQGDVGSGKTAVAVLSMAMTALMGKQAALLAPTSVLASQHYESAMALLKDSGINVALLLGKTKAAIKREIKEQMLEGKASVIIGTHAVLSDDVKFSDLALVIADEQHRFGVKQREKLLVSRDDSEVNSVHNLVMTATPIPRTLAMVIYGDMDTSVIKQKPAGRKEIRTNFLPSTDSDDLYSVIAAKLDKGEQAYIVCSRIDDNGDGFEWDESFGENIFDDGNQGGTPPVSVKTMKQRLDDNGMSARYKTEVLYGSMKEAEKLNVMERFLSGETKILISTTVIEVGVNNPNATMMVIMDAERFGLSTLHQLRGRIGRGDKQSYCILASNSRTELALSRMKLMCECSDGFELAGKDLELRGPGDFFGTRQHGIPSLRAANLFTDAPIARVCCDAVNALFAQGGEEADSIMKGIENLFKLRFGDRMGTL
ncbi:MAG: ATP-dependent DNA helicase RecG [Saccharofermentans sp.]|nr:ATP-dependent DNA helicase RecG [Saccharofermentans sp.]